MASDSWSMGVVLYEVFTRGRAPYIGMSNNDVVQMVIDEGYRMPKPKEVSEDIYDIMMKCWQTKPEDRPDFKTIIELLAIYLRKIDDEFDMTANAIIEDTVLAKTEDVYSIETKVDESNEDEDNGRISMEIYN